MIFECSLTARVGIRNLII